MMTFPRWALRRLAMITALSITAAGAVASQTATPPRPVIVAIADSFPASHGQAVIMRDAAASKEDIIILSASNATPDALGAALQLLRRLRAQGTPPHMQVVTLTGLLPTSVSMKARTWLQSKIDNTLAQQRTRIGNLGAGRWIELSDARIGS